MQEKKAKLVFAYDGSKFCGSAAQKNGQGVANKLNKALFSLGFSKNALFASRTDKGVHANAATACISLPAHFDNLFYLKQRLNTHLQGKIIINQITLVNEDFQPRFDAYMREYRYIFAHFKPNPFCMNYAHFYKKIDLIKLNSILKYFEGEHDFVYLSKQEKRSCIREIKRAFAYNYKDYTVLIFRARGFLRGQIRMSIALILALLENRLSKDEFVLQLSGKQRFIHNLVPPNGLYLNKITYRNNFKGISPAFKEL